MNVEYCSLSEISIIKIDSSRSYALWKVTSPFRPLAHSLFNSPPRSFALSPFHSSAPSLFRPLAHSLFRPLTLSPSRLFTLPPPRSFALSPFHSSAPSLFLSYLCNFLMSIFHFLSFLSSACREM